MAVQSRAALLGLLILAASDGNAEPQFAPVVPGYRLEFPRDHGSHPAFRTEWWYLTGEVTDETGKVRGFQVTFFRTRSGIGEQSKSRFAPSQIIFAHAAISDSGVGRLSHDQKVARAGFGLAEAKEGATAIVLDDWSLKQAPEGYIASVPARDFRIDLTLSPNLPPLLHGQDEQTRGFSRKGVALANASYYYSLPQLLVAGTLEIGAKSHRVSGRAWLDHEWSSEALMPGAQGWDWIGVNLADGGALMAFRVRGKSDKPLWGAATWLKPDGSIRRFAPEEVEFTPVRIWRSPRSQADYPVAMTVRTGNAIWQTEPLMPDQELDSRASTGTIYWEGAIRVTKDGKAAGGGYLELTGYWKPIRF